MILSWRKLTRQMLIVTQFFFTILLLTFAGQVAAHEVRPTIVDFKALKGGAFSLSLKVNLESWLAKIGPEHSDTQDSPNSREYERLRGLDRQSVKELFEKDAQAFGNAIKLLFDGNVSTLTFQSVEIPDVGDTDIARDSLVQYSGKIPAGASDVSWRFSIGASVFRVEDLAKSGDNVDQETALVSTYVKIATTSKPFAVSSPQQQSAFSSFLEYVAVGFDHIVPKGLDHILFVIGLFLLSTRLSPLLWQITSFTIAHTVTLGLGMAGVISIPANIVEPLIAASIVYVAVENIFMDRLSPWRPVLVFFFGLLHGLGFAGVLQEFGLGSGNFLAGLIGFNVGVEIGQLSIIVGCYLLVGFWFGSKSWYHRRVTIPGSSVIALFGIWWLYERVFLA